MKETQNYKNILDVSEELHHERLKETSKVLIPHRKIKIIL